MLRQSTRHFDQALRVRKRSASFRVLPRKGNVMSTPETHNQPLDLTPEEARAVIKAIEDVEKEEAAEQDRRIPPRQEASAED